jgi:hypothetical protein
VRNIVAVLPYPLIADNLSSLLGEKLCRTRPTQLFDE